MTQFISREDAVFKSIETSFSSQKSRKTHYQKSVASFVARETQVLKALAISALEESPKRARFGAGPAQLLSAIL